MIRTLVALAAAATIAGSTVPSHADPFVGRAGTATASVRMRGSDGKTYAVSYRLNMLAPHGGEKTYTLDVEIAKCGDGSCGSPKRYTVRPTAAQVTATEDMSEVTVRTSAYGTTFNLEWRATADPDPASVPVVVVAGGIELAAQSTPRDAAFSAGAWGTSCRSGGQYTNPHVVAPAGYAVSTGTSAPKSAPPQFVRKGRRVPGCVA